MKVKVAIIDNSTGKTGALAAITNYTEFARNEFEFIYILPNGSDAIRYLKDYEIYTLPILELSKNLKNIIFYIPRLLLNAWRFSRMTKKQNIELVHSNDFYNLIAPIGKIFGAKYKLITHVRFMPDRFPSILKRMWLFIHLKFSSRIICVSNAVKSQLPDHQKIETIYDSIPFTLIKKKENSDLTIVQLLYLAHYIPGKGQDLALEAFEIAFQQNKKLRLEYIGGDLGLDKNKQYREKLEKNANDKGLINVISFSGEIESTSSKMIEADIFLNFSESESFSMTTLEALSLGVPTIVSDSGGPKELFIDGESGMLVTNKNVGEMAKAILNLASDIKLRTKFSRNSVQYVQNKFSANNTYELLKCLYKQVIENEIK